MLKGVYEPDYAKNLYAANPTGELDAILQREAVYCAIGRCAGRMKGRISFDQWLPLLESEATATGPNYRIIKRRIAWVIGKWIMEECSPSSNPKVWEILLHLLTDTSAGTDTVVRYSAATALSQCVNVSVVVSCFSQLTPSTDPRLQNHGYTALSWRLCGSIASACSRS